MDVDERRDLYAWLDTRLAQLAQSQNDSHARLRQDMTVGFSGVNTRLDFLNGKTNAHTTELAVLKDRSERAERLSERAERTSGLIGSLTGGGTTAIILIVKSLFK